MQVGFYKSFFLLKILFLLITVIVSLSFLTLLERKIIALSQNRLSPQESFLGLIQPFLDALKLINKKMSSYEDKIFINKILMFICFLFMVYYFLYWCIFSSLLGEMSIFIDMLFFLAILSLSLYPMIFLSFFSWSKYPFLSLLRSMAQSISYEINFSLNIVIYMFFFFTLNNSSINLLKSFMMFWINIVLSLLVVSMVECFRTPFDFSESESELVSGFTSELGSIKFVMIFLSEYMMMLFHIFVLFFFFYKNIYFVFMVIFLFMFSRSVLPRLRYDFLMNLCWMNIFPFLCFIFFFMI